jgi:hypothetical protein
MSSYQVAVTEELKQRERNDPYYSPNAGRIKRNIPEIASLFDLLFGPHQRKPKGKGVYGETFSVILTNENKEHFRNQYFPIKQVYSSFKDKTKVLVKVIPFKQDNSRSKFGMQAALRELHVHTALSQARPITLTRADGTQNIYDIRKFIPRAHAIVMDEHMGYACIIMDYLNNAVTFHDFLEKELKDGRSNPGSILGKKHNWIMYAAEKAFACLWLNGYFHGDVHNNNVMVDSDHKRFYILDFGRAITLQPKVSHSLIQYLQKPSGVYDFWHDAAKYGNQAVYSRYKDQATYLSSTNSTPGSEGLIWHRNGDFLEMIRQYQKDSAKVENDKRREAWGLW